MTESALALIFAPRTYDTGGDHSRRDPRRDPRLDSRLDPVRARVAQSTLPDDAEIVERVRAGNDAIIEQLFRAHVAGLVAFADTYVQSNDVAWEIVQDLFLWLMTHRATWVVPGSVRGYLYSSVRHRALNHLKHDAVERRWSARAQHETPDAWVAAAGDEQLVSAERRRALVAAIAELAESRRTALALRYGHELSYAEIANVLGSSVKAVENQLNRTLHQLRGILERPNEANPE